MEIPKQSSSRRIPRHESVSVADISAVLRTSWQMYGWSKRADPGSMGSSRETMLFLRKWELSHGVVLSWRYDEANVSARE